MYIGTFLLGGGVGGRGIDALRFAPIHILTILLCFKSWIWKLILHNLPCCMSECPSIHMNGFFLPSSTSLVDLV